LQGLDPDFGQKILGNDDNLMKRDEGRKRTDLDYFCQQDEAINARLSRGEVILAILFNVCVQYLSCLHVQQYFNPFAGLSSETVYQQHFQYDQQPIEETNC
jgi:hypothetical protein